MSRHDITEKLLLHVPHQQLVDDLGLEADLNEAGGAVFREALENFVYDDTSAACEYLEGFLSEKAKEKAAYVRLEEIIGRVNPLIEEAEAIADELGITFSVRGGKEYYGENGPGRYDYDAGESFTGYWDPSTC